MNEEIGEHFDPVDTRRSCPQTRPRLRSTEVGNELNKASQLKKESGETFDYVSGRLAMSNFRGRGRGPAVIEREFRREGKEELPTNRPK